LIKSSGFLNALIKYNGFNKKIKYMVIRSIREEIR